MISLKRKEGEAVSRFRERAGLNFSRVDALNIRLSDVQACIFINGLGPEFKELNISEHAYCTMCIEPDILII